MAKSKPSTEPQHRPQPSQGDRVKLPEGLVVSDEAYAVRVGGERLGPLKAGDVAILDPQAKFDADTVVLLITNGERDGLYRVLVAPWQPGYKVSDKSEVVPAALLETLDGSKAGWVRPDDKTVLHPVVGWGVV